MMQITFVISLIIFFFSVVLHECSHGWVAYRLGDPTAKYSGRLSLNPLVHIDPWGTIILPIFLIMMNSRFIFGWAKPVPVNFNSLGHPKRDMVFVGLAGPLANLCIAVCFALLLGIFPFLHKTVGGIIAYNAILINLVLAVFNLIPVPPLDGSRIMMGILPYRYSIGYAQLESYGFFILVLLIYLGIINWFVFPVVKLLARLLGL